MKRTYKFMAALIVGAFLMGLVVAQPASAWTDEDARPFHRWMNETNHATMINALLISANDQIVKHHERYVIMGNEYAKRNPLLDVYGLRKVCDDSAKDAFLTGLKANNLIYLIHVSDDNPMARKMAIEELRLLAKIVPLSYQNEENLKGQHKEYYDFRYWADLLEEGQYPSKRLSHLYVHYTIDIGDYFYEVNGGVNRRFFFWLGYLINDFTVANLCGNEEWMKEDQKYLLELYGDREMMRLPKSIHMGIMKATQSDNDLSLSENVDKTQKILDGIKKTYTDRLMGNDW